MNLQTLRDRALLMRHTEVQGEHRIATSDEVVRDGRTTKIREFAWYLEHRFWPLHPDRITALCGIEGCVAHLGYEKPEDTEEQVLADYRPPRTLVQIFRTGVNRGWFKVGGYSG